MPCPVDPPPAPRVSLYRDAYGSPQPTRRYLHRRRHEIVRELVRKHGSAGPRLEVGIGANLYADVFAGPGRRAVRMDVEREFVRFAKYEAGAAASGRPLFVEGDVLRLPFRPASFDLILFSEVLEHLPARSSEDALRELRRVLSPTGVLILSTPQKYSPVECIMRMASSRSFRALASLFYRGPVIDNEHVNLLSERELLRQAAGAGFRVIERRKCGLYVPVLAELAGTWGARVEEALERTIERGAAGHLLWTQIYVLG